MIQTLKLNDRVTLVTEELPNRYSAAIGVWVPTGSRLEPVGLHGISHFIEHMLFKGSTRYSARDVAEVFDSIGGYINAYTTREYTCYYARVLQEHMSLALDVLGDIICSPRFAEAEIGREKSVVLEEIKMYEDTPDELIHDVLARTVWPENPLGKSVLGAPNTVAKIDREELCGHHRQHYLEGRLVVAAAGSISTDQIVEKVQKQFSARLAASPVKEGERPRFEDSFKFVFRETEQVHLCIGIEGLPLEDKELYSAHLLSNIIGGGLSSRLFQKIREDMGLAYNVYSFHSSYRDTGLFTIYAGLSASNVAKSLVVIISELKAVCDGGITEEELHRNKQQLKGNMLMGLESVSARLGRLGNSQLLLNKIESVSEVLDRLEKLQQEDVTELARRLFVPDKMAFTAIGPGEGEAYHSAWQSARNLLNGKRTNKVV